MFNRVWLLLHRAGPRSEVQSRRRIRRQRPLLEEMCEAVLNTPMLMM
jgi:hypothetical protein